MRAVDVVVGIARRCRYECCRRRSRRSTCHLVLDGFGDLRGLDDDVDIVRDVLACGHAPVTKRLTGGGGGVQFEVPFFFAEVSSMSVLLTPLLLAVSPVSINVEASTYSHATQTSVMAESSASASATIATVTYGGTATYDVSGKPWDNDNDSDADPY